MNFPDKKLLDYLANTLDGYYVCIDGRICAKYERLTLDLIRRHLKGSVSIGLPATDANGYCRWLAFDDDDILAPNQTGHADAIADLLRAKGFTALREGVRPAAPPIDKVAGVKQGRLWILLGEKIEARTARAWARRILNELHIPLDTKTLELFPKKDGRPDKLGAPLTMPFGLHRKRQDFRCFFEGGPNDLEGQINWFLQQPLNDIAVIQRQGQHQLDLEAFKADFSNLTPPRSVLPRQTSFGSVKEAVQASGAKLKRSGDWVATKCPCCELEGKDRKGNNLSINTRSGAYKCHADHTGKQIYDFYFASGGAKRA